MRYSFVLLALVLFAPPATGQSLYEEGRSTHIDVTHLGFEGLGSYATLGGAFRQRLTDRLDVGFWVHYNYNASFSRALGIGSLHLLEFGPMVGFSQPFGGGRWGWRAEATGTLGFVDYGSSLQFERVGVSAEAMLFNRVALSEKVVVRPAVGIFADASHFRNEATIFSWYRAGSGLRAQVPVSMPLLGETRLELVPSLDYRLILPEAHIGARTWQPGLGFRITF